MLTPELTGILDRGDGTPPQSYLNPKPYDMHFVGLNPAVLEEYVRALPDVLQQSAQDFILAARRIARQDGEGTPRVPVTILIDRRDIPLDAAQQPDGIVDASKSYDVETRDDDVQVKPIKELADDEGNPEDGWDEIGQTMSSGRRDQMLEANGVTRGIMLLIEDDIEVHMAIPYPNLVDKPLVDLVVPRGRRGVLHGNLIVVERYPSQLP